MSKAFRNGTLTYTVLCIICSNTIIIEEDIPRLQKKPFPPVSVKTSDKMGVFLIISQNPCLHKQEKNPQCHLQYLHSPLALQGRGENRVYLQSQVRVNFQTASRWQWRYFWMIFLSWKMWKEGGWGRKASLKTSYMHTKINNVLEM